ncbi:predicted protein [Thalassiosira pseudonana CCMP1335]|uniref:Cupin-like domain-containing protein n=1 Tax=Thalassiosira pseudonana TaxID=35128 RepID=B8CEY1_THAPS|nr:predicted protein [Thalassiosira pseudonana CCMP1335]EED87982.1 predicted protein [Thalassiosira pseudonana CCMP1335]
MSPPSSLDTTNLRVKDRRATDHECTKSTMAQDVHSSPNNDTAVMTQHHTSVGNKHKASREVGTNPSVTKDANTAVAINSLQMNRSPNTIQSKKAKSTLTINTSFNSTNTATTIPKQVPSSNELAKSIAKAENELKRSVSHSLKTPTNHNASPTFTTYINSEEKKLDEILRETLTTPVSELSKQLDYGLVISPESAVSDDLGVEGSDAVRQALELAGELDAMGDWASSVDGDDDGESESANSAEEYWGEGDVAESTCHDEDDANEKKDLQRQLSHQTMIRGILILIVLATITLFSVNVHPAILTYSQSITKECSYFTPADQCTNHEKAVPTMSAFSQRANSVSATASFVFATSLRTMILAPLIRLRNKRQPMFGSTFRNASILSRTIVALDTIADKMEQFTHATWEETARQSGVLRDDASSLPFESPPELDLSMLVPCEMDKARKVLLGGVIIESECLYAQRNSEYSCRLRDVITRDLLMEYAAQHFDSDFDLATSPLVLRNLWPAESFEDNTDEVPSRRLTTQSMLDDPQLSNLLLPNHFVDATKTGYDALVPDTKSITLSKFLRNIIDGSTPNAKIGTQVIVEEYPELREEIVPTRLAKELFEWNPWMEDSKEVIKQYAGKRVGRWTTKLPASTYFPVFIAANQRSTDATNDTHPRTDLHSEPIGNIAVQLEGTRRWTLIPTMWSMLLRPSVSKHGRGYIYSNLDPLIELPRRLKEVPAVYECVTNKGDAVWV